MLDQVHAGTHTTLVLKLDVSTYGTLYYRDAYNPWWGNLSTNPYFMRWDGDILNGSQWTDDLPNGTNIDPKRVWDVWDVTACTGSSSFGVAVITSQPMGLAILFTAS